jgi:hypothetical protein
MPWNGVRDPKTRACKGRKVELDATVLPHCTEAGKESHNLRWAIDLSNTPCHYCADLATPILRSRRKIVKELLVRVPS